MRRSSFFLTLCAIGFAGFFGSYLRIPVLPLLVADVGGGPVDVGLVNSAFMFTAGLLSIPAGMLADAVGRRSTVIAGLAAMAVSSFAVAASRSPLQMASAYILFGAGLAAFAPSMMSFVADSAPSGSLARAYGWYTTAVYTAMTFGPATGGFLGGSAGTRTVFVVSGSIVCLVLLLAWRLLHDPSGPMKGPRRHGILHDIAQLFRNRRLFAVLVATVGSCIGFGSFLTFLPLYLKEARLSPGTTGLILGCQSLVNVVARVPSGKIVDAARDRGKAVVIGFLVLATGVALLATGARPAGLAGCAAIIGIGMAVGYPAVGALIAEVVPGSQRGLAMGMYNSCIYLGMMAGAGGLGAVAARGGYPSAFVVAGAATAGATFLFLLIDRSGGRGRLVE